MVIIQYHQAQHLQMAQVAPKAISQSHRYTPTGPLDSIYDILDSCQRFPRSSDPMLWHWYFSQG